METHKKYRENTGGIQGKYREYIEHTLKIQEENRASMSAGPNSVKY